MISQIEDILLVEDRAEDAELALMSFKKSNLVKKTFWVKDGEEALEYIFAEGRYSERNISDMPKLILLDINMPKVNGIDVLRRIRSDERVKHIPIIILSTSKHKQDLLDAYNSHISAFVVKPVEYNDFDDTIKSIEDFWIKLNQRPY